MYTSFHSPVNFGRLGVRAPTAASMDEFAVFSSSSSSCSSPVNPAFPTESPGSRKRTGGKLAILEAPSASSTSETKPSTVFVLFVEAAGDCV